MAFLTRNQLAFIFGLLGNIVSFFVFLAPVPTFYTIYKKKSSEGYQCLPYIIALSSAMLLLYYAFLKKNAYMIISINGIGCAIEVTYLMLYLINSHKEQKISTMKLIILFTIGAYGLMMLVVNLLIKEPKRVTVVGWICAVYNIAVFAAPLCIMRQVIKTKSVEYMPFLLSFFLTLCATTWFFYGFLIKDFYIALPNVLGFLFGVAQMILYIIYKDAKKNVETNSKQHEGDQCMMMSSINNEQRRSYTNIDQQGNKETDINKQPSESNENNI